MNLWECEHRGCEKTAVGVGGAIGLRAIGWYFEIGMVLFCPAHRPDRVPCSDPYSEKNHGRECSLCAAEAQAKPAQDALETDTDRAAIEALTPTIHHLITGGLPPWETPDET